MQKPTSRTIFRRLLMVISLAFLASRFGWKIVAVSFLALWLTLFLPLLVFSIRKNFLQATEPQELRAAQLDEFPRLSHSQWTALSGELQSLGFEPGGVWVAGEQNPRVGIGVTQFFEHPQHRVVGEVSQTFTVAQVLPLVTILVSYWGDAGELKRLYPRMVTVMPPIASPVTASASAAATPAKASGDEVPVYSYATHNRAPHWTFNLLSHPKVMGTRMIGASPEQLLATHLARRELVSRALGEAPIRRDLAEVVHAHSRALRQFWGWSLRTKPFVPALWRAFREDRKRTEIFGELEPAIAALNDKTDA